MEISTVKKIQKVALQGSGFDFIRLEVALFFMVAVLSYSFLGTGGIPNNMFLAAAGFSIVVWGTMAKIAASWINIFYD